MIARRIRVCDPRPHRAVQADQAVQEPTTQLMGQGWVLHFCDCVKAGHAAPPFACCVVMARVCLCEPPPHVAEQADHADHLPTWQLTGQACVLHGCTLAGAMLSPGAYVTLVVTVGNWEPPPLQAQPLKTCDRAWPTNMTKEPEHVAPSPEPVTWTVTVAEASLVGTVRTLAQP